MQKKLKSLLAIASLVGAGAIFFIACGKGDMIELNTSEINEILLDSEQIFYNEVGDIVEDIKNGNPVISSSSEPEPESSSSSQPPTQSSNGGGEISSSSRASTQSSQSTTSSSSRAATPSSSSSKAVSQPANSCGEKDKKSGFTCDWNKTTALTPGVTITPTQTGKGDCTIEWNYAYGNQNPVNEFELIATCGVLDESAGIVTEGSTTYALFAKLTCSDGTHVNKCAHEVTAGAAPYLEGTCVWVSPGDGDPLPKNSSGEVETSAGKGAKPSGVKLTDKDKICKKSAETDFVVKYGDGAGTTWSNTPEAKTYTDVRYTAADCPDYDVVPSTCPTLKVAATAPDEVKCLNTSGSTACTLNGKTMTNQPDNKLSNASEGCMDVTVDWQNSTYPGANQTLKIYVQCSYTGKNQVSKTCKVVYDEKESTDPNQITMNAECKSSHQFSVGSITGVGKQSFYKVCMKVTEDGKDVDTGISCGIQIY